jgi:hypothetical protein
MMTGVLFEPTDDQRRTVKALSGYGVPQDGIAIHIGVDPKTLRKHFRDELDRGSVEATAKVAQTLFHLATVEKNVPSVIFWMKARAGWRETVRQENTGADGQPMVTEVVYRWADPPVGSGSVERFQSPETGSIRLLSDDVVGGDEQ